MNNIPEYHIISIRDGKLNIGSNVSLDYVLNVLRENEEDLIISDLQMYAEMFSNLSMGEVYTYGRYNEDEKLYEEKYVVARAYPFGC